VAAVERQRAGLVGLGRRKKLGLGHGHPIGVPGASRGRPRWPSRGGRGAWRPAIADPRRSANFHREFRGISTGVSSA
jgi:hypothetical protein